MIYGLLISQIILSFLAIGLAIYILIINLIEGKKITKIHSFKIIGDKKFMGYTGEVPTSEEIEEFIGRQ